MDNENTIDDEGVAVHGEGTTVPMNLKELGLRVNVLGVGVSATDMKSASDGLLNARLAGECGYVCVTSVHGVIESQRDQSLKDIHNRSFMTVPDGMPLVWMGREQGFVRMGRVYGPDLMLEVCRQTAAYNQQSVVGSKQHSEEAVQTSNCKLQAEGKVRPLTHFLYGATPETLEKLKANLEKKFPGIQIVGSYAPPFRALNEEEEAELKQLVASCRPDFLWVGLSTPKQERFMAAHTEGAPHELDCGIMLGVGAAFDIHAGVLKDAPNWVKHSGLQWLYRLCQEPGRLWRRYLDIVPTFLWLAALQLLGIRTYEVDWQLTCRD